MSCLLCGGRPDPVLDLGPQPVSHHFLEKPGKERCYPLALALCGECGLVQVAHPIGAEGLKPKYDWVVHVEPSAHLDELALRLQSLPGLSQASRVLGLTYKDDGLIERLGRAGWTGACRLDPQGDLGIPDRRIGMETVRSALTSASAERIARARGEADLVIARHIFKYAHNPLDFLSALARLTGPAGYILIEISECRTALEAGDYSVIWEEHILYLTPTTLCEGLERGGLRIEHFWFFPNTNESCLVAICRVGKGIPKADPGLLAEEHGRALGFAEGYPGFRRRVRERVEGLAAGGGVAILGAGHRSVAFVNLLGLAPWLRAVIDDDPRKQGLLIPGSQLPIRPSSVLAGGEIRTCLLGVKPEDEVRVVARNEVLVKAGGRFLSIFPLSPQFLLRSI